MLKTPHLKAAYRFERESGGTTPDWSGNGNNGTVYGATLVNGKFGKCYDFTTNDYIKCNNSQISSDNFTLSFWIKPSSISTTQAIFYKRLAYASTECTVWALSGVLRWDYGSGGNDWTTTYILIKDIWQHITLVRTPTARYLFVNGKYHSETSMTSSTSYYSTDLYIWSRDGSMSFLEGSLDEVQIYSKSLSLTDIKRIMTGLHPLNG